MDQQYAIKAGAPGLHVIIHAGGAFLATGLRVTPCTYAYSRRKFSRSAFS